ncbi:hypothetical protein OAN33_03830 [Flavobacteriales bacterium]|nr:hypothetical protein [Flavobacteriales bacterium]
MIRLFIILLCLSSICLNAQVPEKMSYQAVVRDANGDLIVNSTVGMKISILTTSATGTAVYVETHTPVTNENGLISMQIGAGIIVAGSFASIIWGDDVHFVKTEIDLTGGSNYTLTIINQMLTVPYAMHAKTVEKDNTGGIYYTGDGF